LARFERFAVSSPGSRSFPSQDARALPRERHFETQEDPHSDYHLFRTATHWRMRAEATRTLVEDAQDSKIRTMMLRIAAETNCE
jgi:hypothetical protein